MNTKSANTIFWTRTAAIFMIAMLLFAAMPVTLVSAAASIFFSPTTAKSNGPGWKNSTATFSSDDLYATAVRANKILTLSNFNFSAIQGNATIDGVEVTVEGKTLGLQADVSLVNPLGPTKGNAGVKTTALGASDTLVTLGGPTDKWGTTWIPSDFTNANFSVKLVTTGTRGQTISIDQVQVKIYYTLGASVLTLSPVSGNYGGTTSMTATLTDTASGNPIMGQSISFSLNDGLNDVLKGMDTTDASGIATISGVSLAGISAGDYPYGAVASFTDESTNNISADLRVIGTPTILTVAPASGTYTGINGTGTTNFSAKLTQSDGVTALVGQTITFYLGGALVGLDIPSSSATTNGQGVAVITGKSGLLAGYDVSVYNDEVVAEFAGADINEPSTGSAALTINPVILTVSGGLTPSSKIYDGNDSAALTIGSPILNAGVISSESVSLDASGAVGTFSDKNIGVNKVVQISGLTLTGLDAGNYSLTQPTRQANITTRPVTISGVVANGKTYDGTTLGNGFNLSGSLNNVVSGDDVSIDVTDATATFAGANVGPYAATAAGFALTGASAGNYALSAQPSGLTATISAKTLTVTADDKSKLTGGADPTFTFGVNGFISPDTFSHQPNCGVSGAHDAVNTYAIVCSGGDAGINYNISYIDGTLTVNNKYPLTVTADPKTITYGDGDPTFTFTYSGFVDGDQDITGTAPTCGVAGSHTNAGGYAISCSGGSDVKYSFSSVSGTLTVNTLDVTVTADANTKVYGSSDPTFTYTFSPALIGSDKFNGTLFHDGSEDFGTYNIIQNTLTLSSNYTITFVGADFSITAKPITVTADAGQSKVFGDVDPTFAYTSSDLAATFSGALDRVTGEDVGAYAIGQGTLDVVGNNYNMSFVSNDFSITAKPVTVTVNAGQSKVYGASDPLVFIYTFSDPAATFTGALIRLPGENVGSYNINQGSLSTGSNYSITAFTGDNFTITAKSLSITANDASKVFGTTLTFSGTEFTAAGLVSPDTVNGVTLTSAGAVSTAPVGAYSVDPSAATGAGLGNYAISYVSGTLIVNAAVPTAITATFRSIKAYDGWVLESGERTNKGGTMNSAGTTFRLGDDAANKQYRSILSFKTTLPSGAVITSAELRIRRVTKVVGTSPFKTHKDLMIDIKRGNFSKVKLELPDFSVKGSSNNVSAFSKTPLAGNWYVNTLNSVGLSFINKTGTTQFRLRFKLDDNNDRGADYASFYSGNAPLASQPVLVITYYIP